MVPRIHRAAVTDKRNPLSLMYSHKAFKLAVLNFHKVMESPSDEEARKYMLLAAAWGGTAIENSMLEAAQQWTAQFNPCPINAADFRTLDEAAM